MAATTFSGQALRFAVTGILNTALDFAVFSALVFVADLHIIAANAVAFLVAVSFSYIVNKKWTFSGRSSGQNMLSEWIRFIVISVGGFILATVILYMLVPMLPVLVAKIIATGASFLWNFLLVRFHIWKH